MRGDSEGTVEEDLLVKVLLLHPGAMGASIGASLKDAGSDVVCLLSGRSDSTRERAQRAGLDEAGSLPEALSSVEMVLSVCPPDAARAVAQAVGEAGFDGTYLDANAIAPTTAAAIAKDVEAHGMRYVDGGIIGPPAWTDGATRLYLSGEQATDVAPRMNGGPLDVRAIEGGPTAASALKMSYASWTKGSFALLLAIRAFARSNGVEPHLLAEWDASTDKLGMDVAARSERAAVSAAPKAWRFVGEMEEISEAFVSSSLPGGFHHGAAEVYRALEGFKDATDLDVDDIFEVLARGHE